MKVSFLAAAISGVALFASGMAAAQADITSGTWMRSDGLAQVRVQKCGEAFCAVNVWVKNPGDEAVGDRLVLNVKPVKPGQMEGSA